MSMFKSLNAQIRVIEKYPKIKERVISGFGTIGLKKFLDELMADAYVEERPRNGFPLEVSSAIIAIALENEKYLESQGLIIEEDPKDSFVPKKWELPKNF